MAMADFLNHSCPLVGFLQFIARKKGESGSHMEGRFEA